MQGCEPDVQRCVAGGKWEEEEEIVDKKTKTEETLGGVHVTGW